MAFKKVEPKKPKPTDEMENALREAKIQNPYSSFVTSCENQLANKGYLSPKQVEALWNVEPPSRGTYDQDEDNPFDPDRDDDYEDDVPF